jgi:predicted DCC family thiol-disulfide oxidoreductase YuxK
LDTVYIVASYGELDEHLYTRARAVLFVLRTLGGIWSLARMFELLPNCLLDSCYDFIAIRRYRLLGRYDSCTVPEPRYRYKFIDTDS